LSAGPFAGRVVLLSGGSSGIGRSTARLFAARGARVVSFDLQGPPEPDERVRHVEVDVADFAAVGAAVARTIENEGHVDCLVNNAGISRDAVIWKMTEEQWDRVLAVDLKAAFNLIHHLAPHLRRRGAGRIVNVSSINALRGKLGLANYAAAKAGLIGLTRSVARELGRDGITVNAVAPGMVLTRLTETLPARFLEEARAEAVLQRLTREEDVAEAILFLCSDAARQITGEVLRVDGGQCIGG